MAKDLESLDWSLVRAFLAVAETGSLSGAARSLHTSQPTLGRQIRALETALGTTLFRRHARGLALSETGAALLPAARAMRDAAGEIALVAAGQDQGLAGVVRLTASHVVSHYLLPPILAAIRAAHPEIVVELHPTDSTENLLFREADIALRMYRPEQLDVVTRHLGDMQMGIYGRVGYLDRAGRPDRPEDLLDHAWVGYDRSDLLVRGMRDMGWMVDRDFFATRCDAQPVYWELVRAGCGLGVGQRAVAQTDPTVEQVLPAMDLPTLPVWLTAHEAMRATPRMRRVWDLLAEGVTPHLA